MNRRGDRKLPADATLDFVPPRWKRFVVTEEGVDRRYYEMAVMCELKDALRSGDVWVVGSRQFKDFDEYLLPKAVFEQQLADGTVELPVPLEAKAYLDERLGALRGDATIDIANGIGHTIPLNSKLQRGDLVFWNGHVGLMRSSTELLHANGFHMQTVIEPLSETIARAGARPDRHRRPAGGLQPIPCA